MLPYAMLMIELRTGDGKKIHAAANELYADGLSFYTALSQADNISAKECVFSFLDYEHKRYNEVSVRDFQLLYVGQSEYAVEYRMITQEKDFLVELRRLSNDYIRYIRLKQRDDFSMMEEMTGFCFDPDVFPVSAAAWKEKVVSVPCDTDYSLQPVEIAVSLDLPHMWSMFVQEPWTKFIGQYWRENGLSEHPVTSRAVTHIYIGSQFCEFLLPEIDLLNLLMDKVNELKLVPVIALPPMRCDWENEYSARIIDVCQWAGKHKMCLELVINDVGTASLIRSLEETGRIHRENYTLTAGILLNKRKKDFRISYRSGSETEKAAYAQTAMDASFYRHYLREHLGIERVSYEACGYPVEISGRDDILHLPLYQMNTAGYCTLHALCQYGDRAYQKKNIQCHHDCERNSVLYPDGLPMAGFGNSVFGCSMKELNDAAMLNSMISRGIKRLVIRL